MDTPEPTLGRDRSLGDVLRDARQAKGLELSDIAEITHVRKEYLEALEQERFETLPEDIYAKNFLKLFAQSVGLKEASVLELYARARGRQGAAPPAPARGVGGVGSKGGSAEPAARESSPSRQRSAGTARRAPVSLGPWLPTVVLIAVVVALALWGFDNFLFTTGNRTVRDAAPLETVPAAPENAAVETDTSVSSTPTGEGASGTVAAPSGAPTAQSTEGENLSLLTLSSEPPGAEVVVDGFLLGTTPLNAYEVSPLANRSLRLSLEGYEPFDAVIDLTQDQTLAVELRPLGQAAPEAAGETAAETAAAPETAPETADEASAPDAAVAGEATQAGLSVTITAPTWLEAYQSTARNVGERLVYRTVQPGDTFAFEFPVYLHVGNAGGVNLARGEQDLGALGSSGEVISRAFSQ